MLNITIAEVTAEIQNYLDGFKNDIIGHEYDDVFFEKEVLTIGTMAGAMLLAAEVNNDVVLYAHIIDSFKQLVIDMHQAREDARIAMHRPHHYNKGLYGVSGSKVFDSIVDLLATGAGQQYRR